MSSVPDKRQKKLILDFSLKRISENQFFQEYPSSREKIGSLTQSMLWDALNQKDADGVSFGVLLMYHFGITKDFLEVLKILAEEPWHQTHEDIVFALGKLKDPSSIEILSRTAVAVHPYLDIDEAFALGTKSIYALEKIQTPEAIQKLGDLAKSENEILRKAAITCLKYIMEKGETETLRAAAAAFLNA